MTNAQNDTQSEEEEYDANKASAEQQELWREMKEKWKDNPFVRFTDGTEELDDEEGNDDAEENAHQTKTRFDELRKKCKNEQLQKPNEAIELLRTMMLQGVQDIEGYFKKRNTKTPLSKNEQAVANYFNAQTNNTKYGIRSLLVLLVVNDLNEMITQATKENVWELIQSSVIFEHKQQVKDDEDTGIDIVKWLLGFTIFLLVLLLIINKS